MQNCGSIMHFPIGPTTLIALLVISCPVFGEKPPVSTDLKSLPMYFERNEGQADRRIRYVSRGLGYSVLLTDSEALLRIKSAEVRVGLVGGSTTPPRVLGEQALSGT